MNRKLVSLSLSLLLVFLATLFAGKVTPAAATSIVPIFIAGNPSCTSLGYDFGFKVDPPNAGTYPIDGINTVTVTTDGVYFDWSSTLGMDAVISKGGSNANLYIYDPPAESFGDTGLHSPINPNNGTPYGLSHIEFCFDYEVTVSKTAETSFTRTFTWDIAKSVTPATWDLFTGDSGTSDYTVTITKNAGVDSDWAVQGIITIANNTPLTATITDVSDNISGFGAVAVDCGVAFPYDLASGASLYCTYSTALPDGSARTNTATVTTSGTVGGGSASADVVFGDPTTVVNDSVTVSDTNGGSWQFGDSGSVYYSRTFTCDEDGGQHDNTATIVETGQSASASVTVNCYELTVTKDANTSFTRTWDWTIEKTGDQTALTLSPGQQFLVNYQVTVNASYIDSDWAVSGNISISNPAPMDADLTTVSDIVSPNILADVDCPSLTVPGGGSLQCTYSADLPDASDRLNTATATLQNYDYDSDGNGVSSGTTDFSGSASVTFSDTPSAEIDECIDVTDDQFGSLGTVCAGDAPKTFTYSMYVGPYDVCGTYEFVNVASFAANDTGATGSNNHTVTVNVPCGVCTLTPGYWKTHSVHGPAPTDDDWFALGDADGDGISEGADETFFFSGKTYYQVLWTAPKGNAYYILGHAYIAAKLNILNGSSTTSQVNTAMAFAQNFFATYTPASTLTKAQRNTAISNATTLDNYNNGLIGPGHCSE